MVLGHRVVCSLGNTVLEAPLRVLWASVPNFSPKVPDWNFPNVAILVTLLRDSETAPMVSFVLEPYSLDCFSLKKTVCLGLA